MEGTCYLDFCPHQKWRRTVIMVPEYETEVYAKACVRCGYVVVDDPDFAKKIIGKRKKQEQ